MEPSTENKPMNMPLVVGGIIFLLIILVLVFTSSNNSETSNSTDEVTKLVNTDTATPSSTPTPVETTQSMPSSDVNAKVVTITAANFSYDVKEIKVNKGDNVKIVFKNSEGFHDFVIDEFNAKTSKLNVGGEETIQFIADKTGSFVYYCSVGQHRAMGMWGTLIVQ